MNIKKIAYSGIIVALSVVMMIIGNLTPATKFFPPIISGFLLMLNRRYYGLSNALATFVAASLIMLFVSPSKVSAMAYIGVFGYYPTLYFELEKIKSAVLRWTIKIVLFEGLGVILLQLVKVFMPQITENSNFSKLVIIGIVFYNIFFAIYEFFVTYFHARLNFTDNKKLDKLFK